MKAYRDIVFIQDEETEDIEGNLVEDYALRLLHHKADPADDYYESVVWEGPTEQDIENTLDYLLQWDVPEHVGTVSAEPRKGSSDLTEEVERDGKTYIITHNLGLSYIGLEEVISL